MYLSVILVIAILLLISGVIWIASKSSKKDKQQQTTEDVEVPAEHPLEITLDAVEPTSHSTDIPSEKPAKEEAPKEKNNQHKKLENRTEQQNKHTQSAERKPKLPPKQAPKTVPKSKPKTTQRAQMGNLRKMAVIRRKPADCFQCLECNSELVKETVLFAGHTYGKLVNNYINADVWTCALCKYICADEEGLTHIRKLLPGMQLMIKPWEVQEKKKEPAKNIGNSSFQWPSTYAVETLKPGQRYSGSFDGESELHKLGYKVTGLNRTKRWRILEQEALPKLGLQKVANTIAANVRLRKKQRGGKEKFAYAITEWEHDLEELRRTYNKRDFQWPSY